MLFQIYGETALYQLLGFVLVFTGLVLANEFARRTKTGGIICFLVLPAALTVYFIAIAIGARAGAEWALNNQTYTNMNSWFHYAKLYAATAGCIGFMMLKYKWSIGPAYLRPLLERLTALAPCYFVSGNHEWAAGKMQETAALLADCGVTWLHNGFVTLQRGGDSLLLAGIDDPNGYADQKTPQQVAREVRDAAPEGFWLLLAHRNNLFESEYAALGADLTLSGHGHGGLWRLPFTDGLLGSGGTLLPSYTNGFYTCRGAEVFVSRGLGGMVRLFNRPEVAVLTLRRA